MNMYFQIAQMLYPLAVMLTPYLSKAYYRKYKRGMLGYYLLMANSKAFRRRIMRISLAIIITYLSCLILTQKPDIGMLSSVAITLTLCCERLYHRLLVRCNDAFHFKLAFAAFLICLFVPHLLALCMTLGIIMATAWMYPKKELIEMVEATDFCSELLAYRTGNTDSPVSKLSLTGLLILLYEQRKHQHQKSGDYQAGA